MSLPVILLLAVIVAAVAALVFIPSARNWLLIATGLTGKLSLETIIAYLLKIVRDLEQHAKDLLIQAEGHRVIAADANAKAKAATDDAAHANKIATNVKALIAA